MGGVPGESPTHPLSLHSFESHEQQLNKYNSRNKTTLPQVGVEDVVVATSSWKQYRCDRSASSTNDMYGI